jgi:hypothetical protein
VIYNLTISKTVEAGTEEFIEYAPDGVSALISLFVANGPSTINCAVKLIWKYGLQDEKLLWTIKGNDSYVVPINLPGIDGINKVAIVLENGEAVDVYMSGTALFEVLDGE